jgi:hypothetical protein
MGYDPSFEYHDYSTIQIWMGKKKTAVGSMVGADLYRKVWGLLDAACPADSKFGECTDPKYVQFESRCLRTWPGGVVPCYTDIYDVYARWDSENIRKLLIGAVAGTLEAITNRPVTGPTNCYDMAGTKACNVGDVIRVSYSFIRIDCGDVSADVCTGQLPQQWRRCEEAQLHAHFTL